MSSSDRGRGDAPGSRHEPAPAGTTPPGPADAADPYANWLDRMQRARARHAAITKNLYTWSNYKNWADKMRDNWEDEDPNAQGRRAARSARSPRFPGSNRLPGRTRLRQGVATPAVTACGPAGDLQSFSWRSAIGSRANSRAAA